MLWYTAGWEDRGMGSMGGKGRYEAGVLDVEQI